MKGITKYLVRWEGWGDATTWEPEANLGTVGELRLAEYLEQKASK